MTMTRMPARPAHAPRNWWAIPTTTTPASFVTTATTTRKTPFPFLLGRHRQKEETAKKTTITMTKTMAMTMTWMAPTAAPPPNKARKGISGEQGETTEGIQTYDLKEE